MLRTRYKEKEIIIRIKRNLRLYSLTDDTIYSALQNAMDVIYEMDSFAIIVSGEYWIIGESQHSSAYPLITVQNIVPSQNIITR